MNVLIRIFLEDLFEANITPKPGECIYKIRHNIAEEAGTPYIKQEEIILGKFGNWYKDKPHLLYLEDNNLVHIKDAYIKKEIGFLNYLLM